jgi:cell wall-associated NlpC family hydrolase
MRQAFYAFIAILFFTSFNSVPVEQNNVQAAEVPAETVPAESQPAPLPPPPPVAEPSIVSSVPVINNGKQFAEFAQTLVGVPYVYGSTDPSVGFDCSGFVNYVAHHFGMKVPRSSVDFTNIGTEISVSEAEPGDFILFTGTDPSTRRVGHMGIVTTAGDGPLEFVHSTSGKAKGVTVSALEGYYETRFVKVIRMS